MAATKLPHGRRRDRGNIHDALFHHTFSNLRNAASELQTLLPEALVKRIKWDKLRIRLDKFVDAKLTSRYSDLLFEVEIDDELAFIYVLLEHKSHPEKWTLLQLLDYKVRIWRSYLREQDDKPRDQLPVILPVVLHHGQNGWTAPRRFIEYFGKLDELLRPYVPNFEILLDDVAKGSPDDLRARPITPEAKLILLCLLLGKRPQRFFGELPNYGAQLAPVWSEPEGALVFAVIVLYMQRVADVPEEETIMALQQSLKLENLTILEEFRHADRVLRERALRKGKIEGMIEGKIKGKIEGKREGQKELLLKQLRKRFGELSTDATATIHAASCAELDEMALRVLTAKTLAEVLRTPKPRRK